MTTIQKNCFLFERIYFKTQSLLQSLVSHDPSEIIHMLICPSRHIYDYYHSWKQISFCGKAFIYCVHLVLN